MKANVNNYRRLLAALAAAALATGAVAEQAALYVNVETGDDANDGRTAKKPFKTVTAALGQATSNTSIHVAAGQYGTNTGERFPLVIGASGVSLLGAGTNTTIDAQGRSRIFLASNQVDVAVRGFTLAGGRAGVGQGDPPGGGALCLLGGQGEIRDCVFRNCSAAGGRQLYGGAVFVGKGSLQLENCRFVSNLLSGGGDSYSMGGALGGLDSEVAVSNCVFAGNYAWGDPGEHFIDWRSSRGGAVYLKGGQAQFISCLFSNNSSRGWMFSQGGALALENVNPFLLRDCRFTGNWASGAYVGGLKSWLGGALYISGQADTGLLSECAFDGNEDVHGRTLCALAKEGGVLKIEHSRFLRNAGYGVWQKNGRLEVNNCLIAEGGGGISVAGGTASVANVTAAAGEGWGVFLSFQGGAQVTVSNSVAWGNRRGGISPLAQVAFSCSQEAHEGQGNITNIGKADLGYHRVGKPGGGETPLAPLPDPAERRRAECEKIGRQLFRSLDLDRPEMQSISKLAAAGRYEEALKAYRDLVVNRMRQRDFGAMPVQTNATAEQARQLADFLVGRLPLSQYKGGPGGGMRYEGVAELSSPPGAADWLDWFAHDSQSEVREFRFARELLRGYAETGDPAYLARYLEILGDFTGHQRDTALRLWRLGTEKEQEGDLGSHAFAWYSDAGAAAAAVRTEELIRQLAILARLITPDLRAKPWAELGQPCAAAARPAELELIPPLDFARAVLTLIKYHPRLLVRAYVARGQGKNKPEQRAAAFNSLALVAAVFPEALQAKEYEQMAAEGLRPPAGK
jgi:hypothetical protein